MNVQRSSHVLNQHVGQITQAHCSGFELSTIRMVFLGPALAISHLQVVSRKCQLSPGKLGLRAERKGRRLLARSVFGLPLLDWRVSVVHDGVARLARRLPPRGKAG